MLNENHNRPHAFDFRPQSGVDDSRRTMSCGGIGFGRTLETAIVTVVSSSSQHQGPVSIFRTEHIPQQQQYPGRDDRSCLDVARQAPINGRLASVQLLEPIVNRL